MAKLVISLANSFREEFPIVKSTTTIGRGKDNDIQLDNPSASTHHAKLILKGNVCTLEDLKSTNGTFVNGKKIDRITLEENDVISIGRYELCYVVFGLLGADNSSDFAKTMFVRATNPNMTPVSHPLQSNSEQETKQVNHGMIKIVAATAAFLIILIGVYFWWRM